MPRFPKSIVAAILATVALVGFTQYRYCWYVTRWPQGMDPNMIMLANRLKEVSAPGDWVAGDQIGVLGYFSDRNVLDTYGLASPEVLPYRRDPDPAALWRYVRKHNAQFLFVIDTAEGLKALDSSYDSVTLIAQAAVQREGAGAVDEPITYRLFRTNWPRQ